MNSKNRNDYNDQDDEVMRYTRTYENTSNSSAAPPPPQHHHPQQQQTPATACVIIATHSPSTRRREERNAPPAMSVHASPLTPDKETRNEADYYKGIGNRHMAAQVRD